MIIGISGKIGSGKDTIGSIINYLTSGETGGYYAWFNNQTQEIGGKAISSKYKGKFEIKKFAGKLKQVISLLTGIPVGDLEKQEVKDYQLGADWIYAETYKDGKIVKVDADYFANDPAFKENPGRFTRHYSVRTLLQKVGTEAMRDVIHPNVWVNALFADYTLIPKKGGYNKKIYNSGLIDEMADFAGIPRDHVYPDWIITDTRFPNEAATIKARGGIVIRVNRPAKIVTVIEDNGIKYSGIPATDQELIQSTHPSETSLDDYKFDYIINNDTTIESLVEKVKYVLQRATII